MREIYADIVESMGDRDRNITLTYYEIFISFNQGRDWR